MSYVVALTGGIGSGKSTIANIFSQLGISVIDADITARQIINSNADVLHAIVARFGDAVLNNNGSLNRRALRKRIFTNYNERNWLNALLHPLIEQENQRQILESTSPYTLWVVPLLIENQLIYKANRILVVDVSLQTQFQRTMTRDSVSHQHVKRILATQTTREARLTIANDVINNERSLDHIILEVICLHIRYMVFATQRSPLENLINTLNIPRIFMQKNLLIKNVLC